MNAASFLADIRSRGATVKLVNSSISVTGPRGLMNDALRADLARLKPDLVRILSSGEISPAADTWRHGDAYAAVSTAIEDIASWFVPGADSGSLKALDDELVAAIAQHDMPRVRLACSAYRDSVRASCDAEREARNA